MAYNQHYYSHYNFGQPPYMYPPPPPYGHYDYYGGMQHAGYYDYQNMHDLDYFEEESGDSPIRSPKKKGKGGGYDSGGYHKEGSSGSYVSGKMDAYMKKNTASAGGFHPIPMGQGNEAGEISENSENSDMGEEGDD